MKTIELLTPKVSGWLLLMALMLPIPLLSFAQTSPPAVPNPSLLPWLGVWNALDDPSVPPINGQSSKAVLKISPLASGNGFEISRDTANQSIKEIVIPDGIERSVDSKNCTGSQTYHWEQQAGLLLGSSDIKCKDSASYTISNLKMMVSPSRMVDILAIKTSNQSRLAVRHFSFENPLPSTEAASQGESVLAMRTALSAPWDLEKIIHLSKSVDVPLLQAALLEKNTPLKLNASSLKQLNSAKVPKTVIDLLVALAIPEKFKIEKNGQIAVASYAPPGVPDYSFPSMYRYPASAYTGYYDPFGRPIYPGYYPSDYYWSYNSPFWWGYPIYISNPPNSGGSGGSGGGGGGGTPGTPNPYSSGRISSENGYIQITPRDTGHRAVPRVGYVPSGSYSGNSQVTATSSGGNTSYTPSSGGGASYSSGSSAGASPGAGSYSAPSASPSGYSSGGNSSGHAVPRN